MTEPVKPAVFLSYASQDVVAARTFSEALRGNGIEVWFDADGGLEHGDEWDAKIRRQIKECIFFVPLISANTQTRLEGYFRIEWDIGAERARGIAAGVPFIFPVVIDDTLEPDALVPDRFRSVQWTRLPGGVVPPDVQARMLKLWTQRVAAIAPDGGGTASAAYRPSTLPSMETSGKSWRKPVSIVMMIGVLLALVFALTRWGPFQAGGGSTAARQASDIVLGVLPFQDMREGVVADHFADSLHEELLESLSQVGNWRLGSRTSGSQTRESNSSLKAMASRLGASHIIEGSIRRQGDEWRLTAQLIEAASDAHLFSYTDNLPARFSVKEVQKQFVTAVIARTKFMLADGDWAYPVGDKEMPTRARLLFRQGAMTARYTPFVKRIDSPDAVALLNESLALAPDNGRILAMHALVEVGSPDFDPSSEKIKGIENELREAEKRSPGLPEIGLARALLALYAGDRAAHLRLLDSIAAKSAGNYDWHVLRAVALSRVGQTEQALSSYERAAALDGHAFLAVTNIGGLQLALRRLDAAVSTLTQAQKRWPLYQPIRVWMLQANLARNGDMSLARRAAEEWRTHFQLTPDDPAAQSIDMQLALLDGHLKGVTEALVRYPEDCLANFDSRALIFRNICKPTLKIQLLAMQGRKRELLEATAGRRLVLERVIANSATSAENRTRTAILLAQLHAFTTDRAKALSLLESAQEQVDLLAKKDSEINTFRPDLAIAWLWAGDRERALALLTSSLEEKWGSFAPIVARDPIWCPLYNEPRFASLLATHGQPLHKHADACRVMQ